MKYEARVQEHLQRLYGSAYIPSPWFQYQECHETRYRFCQPDGLLFRPDLSMVTIVEVKLRHTEAAWWQLRRKYGPVLQMVYPWMRIAYVEFVQWYDITIPFPEEITLRPKIGLAKEDEIQVTIWKP